jgi:hypothetical protein
MSRDVGDEFEARLRRLSPAGPPADLRDRVLARASEASASAKATADKPGTADERSFAPRLALAAALVVAVAAGLNLWIESASSGGGPAPAQPVLVTVPSPVPGAPPIVMAQPRQAPPVDLKTFRKERAQVEAMLRS